MEIGTRIKELRNQKKIRQEDFAADIGVSVQTVSRWENNINYPDVSMLPILASYFKVTTDYLLDVKGDLNMAKLLRTTEVFELADQDEAKKMVDEFKSSPFPRLIDHKLKEADGKVILEVTKEFGVDLKDMKFDR